MDKEVSELVVLQLIHTLISNKNEELVRNGGGINMIGNNLRISLVKLTNEIQNNLLINELTNLRRQSNVANGNRKLGINDILTIVKNLFPEYRTTLNDGQLSLHGLEMHDIEKLLDEKYDRFKKTQVEQIRMMEDEILKNGYKDRCIATATTCKCWQKWICWYQCYYNYDYATHGAFNGPKKRKTIEIIQRYRSE
ncbi:Eaf5p [Saccharomyces cerevisiae AWRI796]|nr:Eaf5p [Saccharomyces cerevisiae AWRI796]